MQSIQDILPTLKKWRQDNQTVVLATGVFDLLHIEHIRFLSKAKSAGDKLIVGVESDTRVSQMKGEGRPINSQDIRQEQLEALSYTDQVFVLPEMFSTQSDWESFMQAISPHIYAVSSHTSHIDNKRTITEKYGGKLQIVHQHNPDYSTTKFHQRLLSEL